MNEQKRKIVEKLVGTGKKHTWLKAPVIICLAFFLAVFHSIRKLLWELKVHPVRQRITAALLIVAFLTVEFGAGFVSAKGINAFFMVNSRSLKARETVKEAKIGDTCYDTLEEAIESAPGREIEENPVCIEILSDIIVDKTLVIRDKKIRLVSEGKYVIKRASGFKDWMFDLEQGAVMDIGTSEGMTGTITIDGGAIWTGGPDSVLERGKNNEGIESLGAIIYIGNCETR